MKTATRARPTRAHAARRCVVCGCADRVLDRPPHRQPERCPSCQTDLRVRPARSYAEMEGLSGERFVGWTTLLERSVAVGLGLVVMLGLFASAVR